MTWKSVASAVATVAGLTFFFYLVGVAVEYRRIKTLGLPAEQVVPALPHDFLLLVGVRALIVPLILATGATAAGTLFAAFSRTATETPRLNVLGVIALYIFLVAASIAFIVVPSRTDLRVEHTILVVLAAGLGAIGWAVGRAEERPSASVFAGVFAVAALTGFAVVYLHALRGPIHLSYVKVMQSGHKQQLSGFYLGKSADDVFLAPGRPPSGDLCGTLKVLPTRNVDAIVVIRTYATQKDAVHCR